MGSNFNLKTNGKKSQTSFDFAKLQIERENGNIASTRSKGAKARNVFKYITYSLKL